MAWGISRLGKALGGLVDMVEAPPQFAWDLLSAPFTDDEYDGLWGTIHGAAVNRAGQTLGGAVGREGFGGQVAGGIPERVRNPISRVFFGTTGGESIDRPGFGISEAFGGGLFGLMEGVGREFIREPLATAMTAASLDESETWGKSWFEADTWRKAHEISQSRSLGQSVALGLMTKDILAEDEITKAQGSPWHGMISGGFDLAARIFLDTDVLTYGFAFDATRAARSQRVAVGVRREAEAVADYGRLTRARDKALAKVNQVADEGQGLATKPDVGRKLNIPATNAMESAEKNAVEMFGDTMVASDMRRATYQLVGKSRAEALGRAVDDLATGDNTRLHIWLEKNSLRIPAAVIADAADDPDLIWDLVAREMANRKGYNALSFLDDAGEEVGLLELGNLDTALIDSAARAAKKLPEELSRLDMAKSQFEAIRRGGWDEALKHAEGRMDKMSGNLRHAREQFVQSRQWARTRENLASLDDFSLAERTEMIRDRFFHDIADGDLVASWFAHARTNQERDALMRFVMGEFPTVKMLKEVNPALGRHVERVAKRRYLTRWYPEENGLVDTIEEFRLWNDPDDFAAFGGTGIGVGDVIKGYGEEVADVISDMEFYLGSAGGANIELRRMMMIAGSEAHFMKSTLRGALRQNETLQKVWESPFGKVRVAFDMVSHPYLNPEDPMIVGKLKRHLRDAGFARNEVNEWLGKYAQSHWDEGTRVAYMNEVMEQGIRQLAKKHGIADDLDLVDEILAKVAAAQKEGSLYSQKAVKFAGVDKLTNTNFSRVEIMDPFTGEVTHQFIPLTVEQLQNSFVMPNFRVIDKGMSRLKSGPMATGLRGRDAITKYPAALADQINRMWKPAVLLRPAWPMRVVFDEQLRMMSVLGVMNNLAEFPQRFRDLKMNYMRDLFPTRDVKDRNVLFMGVDPSTGRMVTSPDPGRLHGAQPVADVNKARRRVGLAGAAVGGAIAGPVGAAVGGGLGAWRGGRAADMANGLQYLHLSSTRNVALDGYHFHAALGAPGSRAAAFVDEVSAGRQLDQLRGLAPTEALNRLRLDPDRWKIYFPDDSGYEGMWTNAVNMQFGNSQFSQRLWDDSMPNDEVVRWLQKDPQGRATVRQMPRERREDLEMWVDQARGFLNQNAIPYTEGTAPLRARMAHGGSVSFDEVKEALGPNWSQQLGSLHGQEIIEISERGSELTRQARRTFENMMRHLGKTPTDTLSRQPYFKAIYEDEILKQTARMRASGDGMYRMTTNELRAVEDQARRIALHKVRTTLYDLAEESQFAQSVRFLMPFFNAWQEVITRYAGIAIQNPLYVSRLYKTYQGTDHLGNYKDEYGNTFMRFRLPEAAKGLVDKGMFRSAIDEQGYVMFDKRGLNMLAQGTPGFGPIVNVAVSEVAKDRPELEESLQLMFPYGLSASLTEAFLPTSAKRIASAAAEDTVYAKAAGRIAIDKLVAAELRGEPIDFSDPTAAKEFYASVQAETKRFFALRTVAGFVSPLAPIWQSPYQDLIDEFRALQRADPRTAEDKFLDEHGDAYFALTQSMSRSIDGVPATLTAEKARMKYEALVEAYPEFGSLIIGSEGGGVGVKFSRAIYDKQFQEAVSEGDPRTRREMRPLTEITEDPDRRLGWQKWSRFYDWKVDQFARLGITSSASSAAEPIMAVQRVFVDQLRQAHPAWFADYADKDETKWVRRMDAFRAIVNDKSTSLGQRRDIEGLSDYLKARAQVERALAARAEAGGSATITSASNRDIALTWDAIQTRLVEQNPMFSDLHARWLQDDLVVRDSWAR